MSFLFKLYAYTLLLLSLLLLLLLLYKCEFQNYEQNS